MAIEQKMKYIGKCPKCELNYIKENEELCSVCSRKRFSDEWYSNDNVNSQERERKLKEIEERQKREELQDKNEILDIMKSHDGSPLRTRIRSSSEDRQGRIRRICRSLIPSSLNYYKTNYILIRR